MSILFDHYKSLLAMARLVAEDDGSIKSLQSNGATKKTHFVKGRPLKMPYSSVLNDDNVSDYSIFHPFGESIAKGESDVLEDLRKRTSSTLGLCVMNMLNQFAELCAAERHPQSLDPVQTRVLVAGKDIDEKTHKSISAIMASILVNNNQALWPVKIFLARNGSTCREEETRHYSRWANISFPMYVALQEEIANKPEKGNTRKFAGVTCNEKTLRALASLLEYIFPNIEKESYYSQGSESELAPFAHAFMKGVAALALQINEIIKIFENLEGFRDTALPSDWMGAIEELDELHYEIGKIPVHNSVVGAQRNRHDNAHVPTNEMGVQTHQPSRQMAGHADLQSQVEESEYIMGPNGLRPNPKYYQRLGSGNWGMMPRANPYDPRGDGQVIVPSGAVPVVSNHLMGGAWS